MIANALLDARNFAEAAPLLAKIVTANPRHLLALDLYGFALLQLGRYDEAREILGRRAKLGLARADTLINLGVACERSEHADEARAHFDSALTLDGDNLQALEGLSRLASAHHDDAAVRVLEEKLRTLRAATKTQDH